MSFITRSIGSALAVFAIALSFGVLATSGPAEARRGTVKGSAGVIHGDGLVVTEASIAEILDCLVGPGVAVSNVQVVGPPEAFGTFTGGTGIIGFESGVILSTGDVTTVPGPNQADDTTTEFDEPGDPDLDALIPGFFTEDAVILEFDLSCSQSEVFSMDFVFASEEYNEFVDSEFNDVFAFFLDGNTPANNVARVPAGCSTPGIAVAINNVNCGGDATGPGVNCNCYRNNDLDDGGGAIDTEMDGLTTVFGFTAAIAPGTHHMKIAIADAGDAALDSAVFLRCESLACSESTRSRKSTWGGTKIRYR